MNDEVIQMRPYRAFLSMISSLVLCMFVWTSDGHALSLTVSDGTNSTGALTFASVAAGTAGCLSGYSCYRLTTWTPGTTDTLTYSTGSEDTWLVIDNGSGFTSGPVLSVKDTATSAVFGLNGGVFQGFSTTTGTLTITLENNFANVNGTRPFGMIESGQFLQPGGNVSGDTLSMLGTVDGTRLAQIDRTAGTGASSPYSLNLSPTISRTVSAAGGTDITYTWTYTYTNSGTATSKFSDPYECFENCPGVGGSAVGLFDPTDSNEDGVSDEYAALSNTICGSGSFACVGTPNSVPEPSSILLLGLAMVMGGFVASRLRKDRETV